MKCFGIFDEIRVNDIKLNGSKSILIRVLESSSSRRRGFIKNISDYSDVLELYLCDYVKDITFSEVEELFYNLNNFILDNDFDEVIVHCSLGISRSPAIMICIAKILGNKELENFIKEKFKFYNKFIVNAFDRYEYTIKDVGDNNFVYAYSNLNNCDIQDNLDDVFDLKKYSVKKLCLSKNNKK